MPHQVLGLGWNEWGQISMNETVTKTYEQAVNDDKGILIADFKAQTSD